MNTGAQELQKEALTDEEVVRRVLAGEHRLYELIMRRYNAMLYRVSMSILNNDAAVEDAMQTTYIKAYEKLADFGFRSALGTWLTRILINESLYQAKKSKQHITMEAGSGDHIESSTAGQLATPATALLNKELGKMLEDALTRLPEKYRLVFVLREVEHMSIAETVDTLNISEANVKVRLNRAKTMLRDSLSSYYNSGAIYNFHLSRCDVIVNNVLRHLKIGG